MILGVGIDSVHIARFAARLHRVPALRERLFAHEELAVARPERLAARFAAKEALIKALGGAGRGFAFRDAVVMLDAAGRPRLEFRGATAVQAAELGVRACHVSLTHEAPLALAVVVLEG